MAWASALFHLVPQNADAAKVLDHPDNKRFVSWTSKGQRGLEVGFHVALTPGRVIARLGRHADLILQARHVSAVHVAFELHPETLVVLLSVRSKRISSVLVTPMLEKAPAQKLPGIDPIDVEKIGGDSVLTYGQQYRIDISIYGFLLVWQPLTVSRLRELAAQHYHEALQRQCNARSRDLPTEDDSAIGTFHHTRLLSARRNQVHENGDPRVTIGEGSFGKVYRAVNVANGVPFAIKVIELHKFGNVERARAAAHRELKTLADLRHKNIIEVFGRAKWESMKPEIYMPLRLGTLRSLTSVQGPQYDFEHLCTQVLKQTLAALDYLDSHHICHRDVKPENILYYNDDRDGSYIFQLADFGVANHQTLASTICGTGYYQAPELFPQYGDYPQSPKMDVWSLFATLIDVHPSYKFPPKQAMGYADVLQAIRDAALRAPALASMVRENPHQRASAAQLLVALFQGKGLTTPRAQIQPITTLQASSDPLESELVSAANTASVRPPLVDDPQHTRHRAPHEVSKVRFSVTPDEGSHQQLRQARPLGSGSRKLRSPSQSVKQQSTHLSVPLRTVSFDAMDLD